MLFAFKHWAKMRFAPSQHLARRREVDGGKEARHSESSMWIREQLHSGASHCYQAFFLNVTLTSHLWNSSKELEGSCVGMFSGPYLPGYLHHPDHDRGHSSAGLIKASGHPFPWLLCSSQMQPWDSSLFKKALPVIPLLDLPVPSIWAWILEFESSEKLWDNFCQPHHFIPGKASLRDTQGLACSHKASSWCSLNRRPALLAPIPELLSYRTTYLSYLGCSPHLMSFFQLCIFVEAQRLLRLGCPFSTAPKQFNSKAKLW